MSGDYFNNLRNEMLEFIPASARVVLDVGCGTGKFGIQLNKKQNIELWGIEPDSMAALEAKKNYHKVYNAFFSAELKLPTKYFDCIIFNDVLEHMTHPEQALDLARDLLTKTNSSCVVCSVPNFRYIKNIFNILVKKDFQYTDSGTLDKTHLRFFTNKSIIRFFNENRFDVIKSVGINPSKKISFHILNYMLFGYINDMRFLQFAVIAKPKPSNTDVEIT